MQHLLEGGECSLPGRQVDVRDVATAHVRAAEVSAHPLGCSTPLLHAYSSSRDRWP